MKRLFIILAAAMMALTACNNQVIQNTETIEARYKMYPTFNMWTLLKLDTQTGTITQVQYSLNDENEFETMLGAIPDDGKNVVGRFELYPTKNNWTFIMLDRIYGDTYHVQWSHEENKRLIQKIE